MNDYSFIETDSFLLVKHFEPPYPATGPTRRPTRRGNLFPRLHSECAWH